MNSPKPTSSESTTSMENPETTEAQETATNVCQGCSKVFTYEPIFIGKVDLARALATHCEECKDAEAAGEAQAARERSLIERRETVRKTLPPALLPKHLNPLGTDTGHPQFNLPMWKLVKQWRPGPQGNWISLIGPAGRCKTRCLALLAEKIIMQGNRLVWTSAMRLYTEATLNLRSRERNVQMSAREHLAECLNTPWLVIDDLGNNQWSQDFESQLFTILDHRKNNCLPIAYSSNAQPEEFYPCITSVNPAALIGRLIDRTTQFDFTPDPQIALPIQ